MRVAVIDAGSNTFLLTIARLSSEGIEPLVERYDVCRLAEGFERQPVISTAASARCIDVLCRYRRLCDEYGVHKIIAFSFIFRRFRNRNFQKEISRSAVLCMAFSSDT